MKKLTFFSRCELVHLYGRLTPHLKDKFQINHIAYSKKEKNILEKVYFLTNVICLQEELALLFEKQEVNSDLINEIDLLIIKGSSEQICLNSSIQNDRTFQFYEYEDVLLLCQSYYLFWKDYFSKFPTDYFIHEPVALFMTQVASYILAENNSMYLSNIQVIGKHHCNWVFVIGNSGELYVSDKKRNNEIKSSEVNDFIQYYRHKEPAVFFAQYNNKKPPILILKYLSYVKFFASLVKIIVKNIFSERIKQNAGALDHIDTFMLKYQPTTLEQIRLRVDRFFFLKYDSFQSQNRYYYYPIHMEPEATVLYWGNGYYKNQVKLIENIAAQLPPCVFLYVKDHPHGIGYRDYIDYKRIKAIPNVKLLDPEIPGVQLIKSSIGIITINGTGGFEGYLYGKEIITFGSNFYTQMHGIKRINHVKNLREIIYRTNNDRYSSDLEYFESIKTLLEQSNEGFTDYFIDYAQKMGINESENAKKVSEYYIKHLA